MVVDLAWCIVNVGAQCSIGLVVHHEFVCSNLGSSLSGIFSLLIAASRVSLLSLSFCTVVNTPCVFHFWKKHAAVPKKICVCLFPVFTLLGNLLHMDLRNAYLYSLHLTTSLYCTAEPHKRLSLTTLGSRLSTC